MVSHRYRIIDALVAPPFDPPLERVFEVDSQSLTVDERIELYLRTVFGPRSYSQDEYTNARDAILHAMAEDLFEEAAALEEAGRGVDHKIVQLERPQSDPRQQTPENIAIALLDKGIVLDSLGRSEEAIVVFDEIVKRFEAANEPALLAPVASALVNKGILLGSLGRGHEAIIVYDHVVNRFGDANCTPVDEHVANALVNKGIRLSTFGCVDDEIAAYDEVIDRFGSAAGGLPLSEHVARALLCKGNCLGLLGRHKEELAAYDEVIGRFSSAADASLKAAANRAQKIRSDITRGARMVR